MFCCLGPSQQQTVCSSFSVCPGGQAQAAQARSGDVDSDDEEKWIELGSEVATALEETSYTKPDVVLGGIADESPAVEPEEVPVVGIEDQEMISEPQEDPNVSCPLLPGDLCVFGNTCKLLGPNAQAWQAQIKICCDQENHRAAMRLLELYGAKVKSAPNAAELANYEAFLQEDLVIRLRYKMSALQDVHASTMAAKSETWSSHNTIGRGSDMAEMWARLDGAGSAEFRCRCIFDIPLFELCSLFNEVDLFANWLPFVTKTNLIEHIGGCGDYAQLLLSVHYILPWPLPSRESVLYAFASNGLEHGSITIHASSVPEAATEWWGYAVPPARSPRADVTYVASITPCGDGMKRSRLDLTFKFDPKVPLVPQWVLNSAGKQYVKLLCSNVQSLAKDFSTGPYPARVKRNERGVYTHLERCLAAFTAGQFVPTPPVGSGN